MKEKLKNLMKNKIFIGCAAAVLIIAIAVTAILLLPSDKQSTVNKPESADTSSTDTVPEIDTPDTSSEPAPEETEKTPSDVTVDLDTKNPNKDVQAGSKADTPEKPVNEKEPEKPADTNNGNNGGGGINIGNPPADEKYSCGSKNHHCQTADAHAWILNLETEGCNMCGSHTCPSFYATDEWGGASPDSKKCPKYNEKSDPTKYCQSCSRLLWSQSNPTGCFRYLQDTTCECGELVKGNTCHHH